MMRRRKNWGCAGTGVVLCLLAAPGAHAQAERHLTVDSRSSMAWWQVDPHMNHLWATTCPREPSWSPGEGRSGGWTGAPSSDGYSGISDTINVPRYPRITVRPLCMDAIQGRIVVQDPIGGRGAWGEVIVNADSLFMGEERRWKWARDAGLQTRLYPEIRFQLDSVINVSRQGDTLRGTAVGILFLHGQNRPVTATVKVFPDSAAGATRVLTKVRAPAREFISDYWPGCLPQPSCLFALGVRMNLWKHMFFGADLVLRPEEPRVPATGGL